MMRNLFVGVLLSVLMVCGTASPSPAQGQESHAAKQVFSEILRQYQGLQDYTVQLQGRVKIPGFRVPDFTATLYYKKPDKFHIETKSFAPLPRNSGVFNPFQFDPDRHQITYRYSEDLDGARADVYRVEPGENDTRIRFFNVWVGGQPKRVLQVESHALRGTKALVKMTYQAVPQGVHTFLLPEKVQVHLFFPTGETRSDNIFASERDNSPFRGMMKVDEWGGEGDVFMGYSGWQINTGLDDQVFKQSRHR